ncbi:MAG: response regulator transcription factor [Candidatus Polarisedimenticolia bacterium]
MRQEIFVVEDDPLLREGLCRLLEWCGLEVEAFPSAERFLIRPTRDDPACLVLDVMLPGMTGLQLQDELRRRGRRVPIIFLTGHGSVGMGVTAMKNGAIDFLTKPPDVELLLAAILRGLEENHAILRERELNRRVQSRMAALTPRELEVLRYVIGGALNKQTAFHLGISEKTVKVHRAHIMEKTGAASVADLVRLCIRARVEPEHPESRVRRAAQGGAETIHAAGRAALETAAPRPVPPHGK